MCANCYGQTELPSMAYEVDSTGTVIFKHYTPNLLGQVDDDTVTFLRYASIDLQGSPHFTIRDDDSVYFESDDIGAEKFMQEYATWNKGFTAGLQTAVDLLKSKTGATDDIEVLKMKMFAEYLKSKK